MSSGTEIIIIAACCGGAGLLAVIIGVICCCKRSNKGGDKTAQQRFNAKSNARRTLADDEAELDALERQQHSPSKSKKPSKGSKNSKASTQAPLSNTRWSDDAKEVDDDLNPDMVDLVVSGKSNAAGILEEEEFPTIQGSEQDDDNNDNVINNPLFDKEKDETKNIPIGIVRTSVARFSTKDLPQQSSDHSLGMSKLPPLDLGSYPTMKNARGIVRVRDWAIPHPGYQAVSYSVPPFGPDFDPDTALAASGALKFNAVDRTSGIAIDRTSHMGPYRVAEGLPRNPFGRTGIDGRGVLPRWGPNHAAQIILTRWAVTPEGDPVFRDGHRVMEAALIENNSNNTLSFPEGFLLFGQSVPLKFRDALGPAGLVGTDASAHEAERIVREVDDLLNKIKEIHRSTGPVDDPRNTDQCWVEAVTFSCHDNTGLLNNYAFNVPHLLDGAKWVMVSRSMALPSLSLAIMQQVVETNSAFWADKMIGAAVSVASDSYSTNLMYNPPLPGMINGDAAFAAATLAAAPSTNQSRDFLVVASPEPEYVSPQTVLMRKHNANMQQSPSHQTSSENESNRSTSDMINAATEQLISASSSVVPPPLPARASSRKIETKEPPPSLPPPTTTETTEPEPPVVAVPPLASVAEPPPPPAPAPAPAPPAPEPSPSQPPIPETTEAPLKLADIPRDTEEGKSMRRGSKATRSIKKTKHEEKKEEVKKEEVKKEEAKKEEKKKEEKKDEKDKPITRSKEGFIAIYEAKYMGSVSTTNNGGVEAVLACIKAVTSAPSKEQPSVLLVVSAEGIDIEEAGKPDAATGSTITAVPGKIIRHVPIRQIAFVKEDTKNKKVVGFIASDPKTGSLMCHVFQTVIGGLTVSDSITKSFKLAAQLRTDPFAVSRDSILTPDAATPELAPFQIARKDLEVKMIIGHGQYGKVYLAEHKKAQRAVKLIKVDASAGDEADFLSEVLMLLNFNHPKLLNLCGVCLEKKPWLMITDYMQYKDLGVVVKQSQKLRVFLQKNELLYMAIQVAEGLDYLTQKRFVHRDIAARNVLLDANNICKIADFGLTRKLPDGQDFWKLDKAGKLPVKYMSIEAMTLKRFSAASDVWAFGVFLWELLSYCESPWDAEGVQNTEIRQALVDGKRLSCPECFHSITFADDPDAFTHEEDIHNRIFAICQETWRRELTDRPNIGTCRDNLQDLLDEENKSSAPIRDIGLECFKALEAHKGRGKAAERGGSVIRPKALAE